jgi:acyl carrier protein
MQIELLLMKDLTEIFRAELDDPKLNLVADDTNDTIESWDSLAHVRIIAAVERQFGIQFDFDEIETISSIAQFVTALRKHGV